MGHSEVSEPLAGAPIESEGRRVRVFGPDHPELAPLRRAPAWGDLVRALGALPREEQRRGDIADHHLEVGMIVHPRPRPHAVGPAAERVLAALGASGLPRLADAAEGRPLALRRAQLNRMADGAYNRPHRDDDDDPEYTTAAVLVLSAPDRYAGGALHFPDLDLSLRPPAGALILFPAALLHGVTPVCGPGARTSLILLFGPRERGGWTTAGFTEGPEGW